jgi:D-methionine transport system substrate-binding protein
MKRLYYILSLSILFFGCQKNENLLKVSATYVPHKLMLEEVKDDLKNQGIELEITAIEDYQTANRALNDGEGDANFFQHQPFLELQLKQMGLNLESAGKIHIEPMGAYSKKITSLENLPLNAIIAIPNDPSNESRALLLLKEKGLITLTNTNHPTLLNYQEGKYKFIEIDAAMLPRVLDDVDMALIPTNFALQANLSPQNDALIIEDSSSPYVNIIVVRKGDKDNPKIIALILALKSEKMKAFIEKKFNGSIEILN